MLVKVVTVFASCHLTAIIAGSIIISQLYVIKVIKRPETSQGYLCTRCGRPARVFSFVTVKESKFLFLMRTPLIFSLFAFLALTVYG